MTTKSKTIIQTEFGPFAVRYHDVGGTPVVSFTQGDITRGIQVVRMHSACLFGEAFHSLHCDCEHQLSETMRFIERHGSGIILYSYEEGRGIGLEKKIAAMELQRATGCDTVEAFKKLGLPPDCRDYADEVAVLQELGVPAHIYSFSGNPIKRRALEDAGFHIDAEYEVESKHLSQLALREKRVKSEKMDYSYKDL